jgi:hypothetical protein
MIVMQGWNVNIQNRHHKLTDPKPFCQPCEDIEFPPAFGALEVAWRQYRNKESNGGKACIHLGLPLISPLKAISIKEKLNCFSSDHLVLGDDVSC